MMLRATRWPNRNAHRSGIALLSWLTRWIFAE